MRSKKDKKEILIACICMATGFFAGVIAGSIDHSPSAGIAAAIFVTSILLVVASGIIGSMDANQKDKTGRSGKPRRPFYFRA